MARVPTALRAARRSASRRLPQLAAALALLLALGCHDSPSEPSGEIGFQSLSKTMLVPRSGPAIRTVVHDETTYAAVWRELWGDREPARPNVDFDREMVIVATATLGCFGDVQIEEVQKRGGQLEVTVGDAGPEPLCLCAAPEYVFHVVRASRVDGPASFAVHPIRSRCG
jgi:hypothetical protein